MHRRLEKNVTFITLFLDYTFLEQKNNNANSERTSPNKIGAFTSCTICYFQFESQLATKKHIESQSIIEFFEYLILSQNNNNNIKVM